MPVNRLAARVSPLSLALLALCGGASAAHDTPARLGQVHGHAEDHRVFAAGDPEAARPPAPSDTRLLRSEGGALFVPDALPDGVRAAAPPAWWMLIDAVHTGGHHMGTGAGGRLRVPDLPRRANASPWQVPRHGGHAQRLRGAGVIEHAHRFEAGHPAQFTLAAATDAVRVEVRRDIALQSVGAPRRTALRIEADGQTLFDGLPPLPARQRVPYRTAGSAVLLETVAELRIRLPPATRVLTIHGEPGAFLRVHSALSGSAELAHAGVHPDDAGDAQGDAAHARALNALPDSRALLQLSGMGYYREVPVALAGGHTLRARDALPRPLRRGDRLPDLHGADALHETDSGHDGTFYWLPPGAALHLDEVDDRTGPALYRFSVASPRDASHASDSPPDSADDAAEDADAGRIPLRLIDARGAGIDLVYDPPLAAVLGRRAYGEDGLLAWMQARAPGMPVVDVSRARLLYADGRRPQELRNLDPVRGVWVRIERHSSAVAPLAQIDGQPRLPDLAAALRADLRGEAATLTEDRSLEAAAVLIRARRAAFLDQRCATPQRPVSASEAAAALALARRLGDDDPVLTRCALVQAVLQAGGPDPDAIAAHAAWASAQGRTDLVTGLHAVLAVERDTVEAWQALAAALDEEGEADSARWVMRVAQGLQARRPDPAAVGDGPATARAVPGPAADGTASGGTPMPAPAERPITPEHSAGRTHITLASRTLPQLRWRGTAAQPLQWRLRERGRYRLELRATGGGDGDAQRLRWVRIDTPDVGTARGQSLLLPLLPPTHPGEDAATGQRLSIAFETLRAETPLRVVPLDPTGQVPAAGAVLAELRAVEDAADTDAPQDAAAHDPEGMSSSTGRRSAVLRWLERTGVRHAHLPLRTGMPAPDPMPAEAPDTVPMAKDDADRTGSDASGMAVAAPASAVSVSVSADAPSLDMSDGRLPRAARFPSPVSDALVEALWLRDSGHPEAASAAGWALHRAAMQTLSPQARVLRDRLRAHYRWAPYRQILSSAGQWLRPLADGQLRSPEFVARSALGGPLAENDIVLAPERDWHLSGFAPGQAAHLQVQLHAALPSARLDLALRDRTMVLTPTHPLQVAARADENGEIALRLGPSLPATYVRVRVDGGETLRTAGSELYHLPPLQVWSEVPQALLITEWNGRDHATRVQWVGSGETVLRGETAPGAALRVDALQPRHAWSAQAPALPGPGPSPSPLPARQAPEALAVDIPQGRLRAVVDPLPRTPGAYLHLLQRRDVDADDATDERVLEAGARWRLGARDGGWRLRLDAFGRHHDAGMRLLGAEATLEWRMPEAPWEGSVQLRALHQPGTRIDARTPIALRLRADIAYDLVVDDRWEYTVTAGVLAHASNLDRLSRSEARRVDSDLQSRYRIDHPQQPFLEQRLRWRADWRTTYSGHLSVFGNAPGELRPDHVRVDLDWHRVGPRWVLNAGAGWRHAFADADRARAFDRVRVDTAGTGYRLGPVHGWRLRVGAGYDLRAREASVGVLLDWFRHDGRGLEDLLRSEVPLRGVLEHDLHAPLRGEGAR